MSPKRRIPSVPLEHSMAVRQALPQGGRRAAGRDAETKKTILDPPAPPSPVLRVALSSEQLDHI